MRRMLHYTLAGLLLIGASCGNKGAKTTTDQAATKAGDSQMMASHSKKYSIKSGIITFSVGNSMTSEKQVKKVYFDDFGVKETSEVYSKDKLVEKMINKADGYVYQISVLRKSGIRSKHAMATGTEMKFDVSDASWPNDMKKQYNYTKLPNEKILDKDCEIFTTEYEKLKAKYAGWNGMLLMIETSMPMGTITMTTKTVATKIEENAAIPESVWEVPAGITLTEQ
jgi:hypothetical protein